MYMRTDEPHPPLYQGTSARLASHSACRFRPTSSSVISPPSALYASSPSGSLTGWAEGVDSRDAAGDTGIAEFSECSAPWPSSAGSASLS